MDWVKNKMKDKRLIGASRTKDIFTWVDTAYAVHADMLSQNGGAM